MYKNSCLSKRYDRVCTCTWKKVAKIQKDKSTLLIIVNFQLIDWQHYFLYTCLYFTSLKFLNLLFTFLGFISNRKNWSLFWNINMGIHWFQPSSRLSLPIYGLQEHHTGIIKYKRSHITVFVIMVCKRERWTRG